MSKQTFGQRPTWAEINLNNLAANFHSIKQRVGKDVSVMPMVKADAYGHGAVNCAKRLELEGAAWFGVATPEEGIELREAGIRAPILSVGGFWRDQAAACIQQRITPVVYRLDMIQTVDEAARNAGETIDIHVKVDTGMGRLGVRFDQLNEFVLGLNEFKNIRVDGVLTHFAAADDAACQPLTHDQIRRFNDAVGVFHTHGHKPTFLHLANSAGIYGQHEGWGNMVRPGGALYGLWRDVLSLSVGDPKLLPVMSLYSRISLLKWVPAGETIGYGCTFEASRKTLIGTVPIGYHDGYIRGLSNRAHVIVRHAYAPVVGRVSMDLTLIDVTGIADVAIEDKVTLLGSDEPDSKLSVNAEELARIAGTLSYEVTCGVSGRVPRIYTGQDS
jgi:alanine racemase